MRRILSLFLIFMLMIPVGAYAYDGDAGFGLDYCNEKHLDIKEAFGDNNYCVYACYHEYKPGEERTSSVDAKIGTADSTYIDIDLENQHVTFYENGVAIIDTDCVSGDVDDGRTTPKGIFKIEAKVNGKYLTGPTWKCWVDYWMSFNGSIGLHDASWRSEFGGDLYKTKGSHGCVNIPKDKAEAIYKRCNVGTVVIVR